MTRLDVNKARCAALFASGLQRSDAAGAGVVTEAISGTVRRFGIAGCVGVMAREFGDHPEAARDRMRWARYVVTDLFAPPRARIAQPGAGAGWSEDAVRAGRWPGAARGLTAA
jgi:hypothetical protein